jgi:hypothetical protein
MWFSISSKLCPWFVGLDIDLQLGGSCGTPRQLGVFSEGILVSLRIFQHFANFCSVQGPIFCGEIGGTEGG